MKVIDLTLKEQIQKGTKVLFWNFKETYTMTGETDEFGNIEVIDKYGNKSFKLKSELKVIVPYSNLNLFEVGEKVEVKVRNHRTGMDEFRDGVIIGKSMVHPSHGSKHRPYPIVFVRTMFTYYEGDSNGNGVFYDKENVTGVIYLEEIRIKS
jgi:hypothetical protein